MNFNYKCSQNIRFIPHDYVHISKRFQNVYHIISTFIYRQDSSQQSNDITTAVTIVINYVTPAIILN